MADATHFQPRGRLTAALLLLAGQHRVAGLLGLEIRPRHARLHGGELRGRGVGHDRAPLAAAARAEVEGVVGRGDNVAVMLHHHDRVAEIAELAKRGDQTMRVSRMEADRRLVEHVEHARQAAAHLGREANSLQLAAGEAARGPGHVEILKPYIDQKRDAGIEFAEQIAGDRLLTLGERDGGERLLQSRQWHPAPDVERAAPERDGTGHVG